MRVFLVCLLLLNFLGVTLGSNILIIAPIATKSHMNFIGEVGRVLADRGHQVTFFKTFDTNSHPNITSVNSVVNLEEHIPNTFKSRNVGTSMKMLEILPDLCTEAMSIFREKNIDVKKFDIVFVEIFGNECFLAELKDVNFGFLNPNVVAGIVHKLMGNLYFPSFEVMVGVPLDFPMSFLERMGNLFSYILLTEFYFPMFYYNNILETCKEAGLCSRDIDSLLEIGKNASIVFSNSVRSLEYPPTPMMPNLIHTGALNCRDPKPLPKDLEEWINGAGSHGVIYFSLGTVVKISSLPEKHRKTLLKVFSNLPQRILWKADVEAMEDLPENVKLAKWLPQQDILGHPQVKLFITHGGLFSITETTYHAVPILGIPVFGDQENNMRKVEKKGFGIAVEWDDLTEELLMDKIQSLLYDKKYKIIANERSLLLRDQPISPQDSVVYWTEYAIRHAGARHLQSPVHQMKWYELYNIDVWFTFLLLVVLVITLMLLFLVKCLRFCGRKFSKKTESKKKKN